MPPKLLDRKHAGLVLAEKLSEFKHAADAIAVALPRGGVPAGFEIARLLQLPLDICVVRKLGAPSNPELAMGAVGEGGVLILNDGVIHDLDVPAPAVEREIALEREAVAALEDEYRGGWSRLDASGKTVILVDDGIATGSTVRAAIRVMQRRSARRIIVAAGVAPKATAWRLSRSTEVVTALCPESLESVSQWYNDFPQVSSREVRDLLARSREWLEQRDGPGGFGSSTPHSPRGIAASHGRS